MKLLLPYKGRPLLCHALEALSAAGAAPVLCVLGFRSEAVLRAVRSCSPSRPIRFLVNPAYASGRASSVRLGLEALPESCEAAVLLPGDMPLVRPQDVRAVLERFEKSGAPLVVAVDEAGQRAHPVLFARRLFPRLSGLQGDESGQAIIRELWESAEKVLTPGHCGLDVDREEDYRHLLRRERRGHARFL